MTDLMAGGTKLEHAFMKSEGVLPLSIDWLAKNSGGVFKSESAAHDAVKQFNQTGGNPYYLYLRNTTPLTKFEYRLDGQSGLFRTCLSKYTKVETKIRLEALFDSEVLVIKKIVFPTDSLSETDDKVNLN
jgi:hypothetical protein